MFGNEALYRFLIRIGMKAIRIKSVSISIFHTYRATSRRKLSCQAKVLSTALLRLYRLVFRRSCVGLAVRFFRSGESIASSQGPHLAGRPAIFEGQTRQRHYRHVVLGGLWHSAQSQLSTTRHQGLLPRPHRVLHPQPSLGRSTPQRWGRTLERPGIYRLRRIF